MAPAQKLTFLALLLLGPASLLAETSSQINTSSKTQFNDTDFSVNFKSEYDSQTSKLNKANRFQIKIGAELSQKLNDTSRFDLEASINLEKGSSDSLFDNSEFKAENDISLKKAEFTWTPLSMIELKAGAISLKDMNHSLLLGGGAFVGAKETLQYQANNLAIKLSALQSTPNNRNYSNRLEEVEEGNPIFYAESLNIKLGTKNNSIQSTTSHFAFDNLSNSVASKSQFLGNSVDRIDDKNAEFKYSYIGWAQRLEGKITISDFSFSPFAEYIKNDAAEKNNTASLLGLKATYSYGDKDFSVTTKNFRSEADASVGYYNSLNYGHNNRVGSNFGVEYLNNKTGVEISASYTNLNEIEANQLEVEDEDHIYSLILRKSYDIF